MANVRTKSVAQQCVSDLRSALYEGACVGAAEVGHAIDAEGYAQLWFNRLIGLRYMEVHGFLPGGYRLFTDEDGLYSLQTACYVDVLEGEDLKSLLEALSSGDDRAAFLIVLEWLCEQLAISIPQVYGQSSLDSVGLLPISLCRKDGALDSFVSTMTDSNWSNVGVFGLLYQTYGQLSADFLEKTVVHPFATPEWMSSYLAQNTILRSLGRSGDGYPAYAKRVDEPLVARKKAVDLRLCDPACGSGMLLAAAFDVLMDCYASEGYSAAEASHLIVDTNIAGFDIDPRAVQICALVMAMKAREHDRRFFRCGVSPKVEVIEANRTFGAFSLVDGCDSLLGFYDVVLCDPPFLGSGNYSAEQATWFRKNYPDSFKDIAAAFVECCSKLAKADGFCGTLIPLVWLYIESYSGGRKRMLEERSVVSLVKMDHASLGRAWGAMALLVFGNMKTSCPGCYIDLGVVGQLDEQFKLASEALKDCASPIRYDVDAASLEQMPATAFSFSMCRSAFEAMRKYESLDNSTVLLNGLSTGDNNRFIRKWWEVSKEKVYFRDENNGKKKWFPCANSGGYRKWYGNNDDYVNWANEGVELEKYPGAMLRNTQSYFKENVGWGKGSAEAFAARFYPSGGLFTATGLTSMGKDHARNLEVLATLNSSIARYFISRLSPTQSKSTGDIGKVPFAVSGNLEIERLSAECVELARLDDFGVETSDGFVRRGCPLL